MPAHDRVRSDHAAATQCAGQPPHERGEHGPVRPVQARTWVGTAQDGDLVAQHEELDVLGDGRATRQQDQPEHPPEDQVQQPQRHAGIMSDQRSPQVSDPGPTSGTPQVEAHELLGELEAERPDVDVNDDRLTFTMLPKMTSPPSRCCRKAPSTGGSCGSLAIINHRWSAACAAFWNPTPSPTQDLLTLPTPWRDQTLSQALHHAPALPHPHRHHDTHHQQPGGRLTHIRASTSTRPRPETAGYRLRPRSGTDRLIGESPEPRLECCLRVSSPKRRLNRRREAPDARPPGPRQPNGRRPREWRRAQRPARPISTAVGPAYRATRRFPRF